MQDALTMASIQHVLYRNVDRVGAACLSFPCNTLGAMITSTEGLFRQTIYWPLQMLAQCFQGEVVDCYVAGPTFTCHHPRTFPGIVDVDEGGQEIENAAQRELMMAFENLPYLDACATYDRPSRRLSLSVVNRHETEAIETHVQILGATVRGTKRIGGACGQQLTAASVKVENSLDQPDSVCPAPIEELKVTNDFRIVFPARSHTVFYLDAE